MRLLITTQTVDLDDPILGFMHRWIEAFATRFDSVEVICLKKGRFSLPSNVHVHSLGKERGLSRVGYILNFYRYIWQLRREYDAVFVHMNPEYIVMGGLCWKLLKKRVVLWYVHRQVTPLLRIAEYFADSIASAAPESFTLRSKKLRILGHGIEVALFASNPIAARPSDALRMVAVGRITPIKNIDIAIQALAMVRAQGINASLELIGEPVRVQDQAYRDSLRQLVQGLGVEPHVSFLGAVRPSDMPRAYERYDMSINLSPTGGIDKAVVESMAAGLPVVVSNEAFRPYFGAYAKDLVCAYRDAVDVSEKIAALYREADSMPLRRFLRNVAEERFDLHVLIGNLTNELQ